MECTDVSADIHTEGVVLVGQSNTDNGIFEQCDPLAEDVDNDWHMLQLEYGKTYLLFLTVDGTAPTLQPEFTFYDRFGNMETVFDTSGVTHFRYTARYTGRYYVSATQGSLLSGTTYAIDVHELRDDTKGSGPTIRLNDGYAKLDEIEIVGDTDTFDFEVFANRAYRFIVVGDNGGQTLADPSIELLRDGSLIANGDNFIGFDSAARETLQVRVGGNAGTGTYQVIGLVADDAGQDTATTSQLTFDADGLATKEGYISEFRDFDWHKVELNAGDIVRVELKGVGLEFLSTPNLVVRDPGLTVLHGQGVRVPSDDALIEYIFEAQTSGTYYLVARTKIDSFNGAYSISAEKIRTPAEGNYLFGRGETTRLLLDDNASVPLSSLLDLSGLDPFAYEVYSSVPLIRDGNVMAENNQYGIIAGNIGLWSVDASQLSDIGELMVRAVVTGEWSEWQKFALTPAFVPDGLASASTWTGTDPVTYRFVSSRPDDYGSDEFGEFRGIPEVGGLGQAVVAVFEDFSRVTGRQIVRAEAGSEADMNIFATTELGQPFLSFLPADGRGGDIIFNEADFTGSIGTVQEFRMLRAIGTALGLNFNNLSRQDSVLGSQAHTKSLLPVNFGKDDWIALQEIYGTALRDPSAGTTRLNNYVLTGETELSTVSFEGRNIIVGSDVINEDFVIDLRDGRRSFAREDGVVTSEVVVGYGAQVENGVGGDGDDFIFGNGLANVLQGGGGNDFLTGFENDDVMIGGPGDDTFIHYFGDGKDYVSDESGIDTLCFIGRGPFENERLFEDFEFTLNGQFLEVSLTLDGGPEDGFVRIDTGFNNNNLVESLELWHEGALRERISLFSLFNELTDGQTSRFTLLSTSDNFGRLVTPV